MSFLEDQLLIPEEVGIRHLAFDAAHDTLLKTTHSGRAWIELPDGDTFTIPTENYRAAKTALQVHDAKLSPSGKFAALTVGSHVILAETASKEIVWEARVSNVLGFILSRGQAILLDDDQLVVSLDTGRIVGWGLNLQRRFTPTDSDAPQKLARQPDSEIFWGSDGLHIAKHDWNTGIKLETNTLGYRIYDIAIGGNRLVVRGGVGLYWFDLDRDDPFSIESSTDTGDDPWYAPEPAEPTNSIHISAANPRIAVDSEGRRVAMVSKKKLIVADIDSRTTREFEGTEFLTYATFYKDNEIIYGTRDGAVRTKRLD